MKKVLKKYKILIWIWSAINVFALVVNTYEIKPKISMPNGNFYLFTCYDGETGLLWPFVKFEHVINFTYGTSDYHFTQFNGIFYGYDIHAFLLYMVILIAFLGIKIMWKNQRSAK